MVTAQFMKTGRKKTPQNNHKETDVEMTQTSLWSRLTNSRLSAFLYGALFLPCDQSNRWNVTGNNRNISIYSRSRVNRLKQLFGLQLSVCTNVNGRWGGGHAEPPTSQVGWARPGLTGALCNKAEDSPVFGAGWAEWACLDSVCHWAASGHWGCLMPASLPEICSGGRANLPDLAGEVGAGAINYGALPVKQEEAILIKSMTCVNEAELRWELKLEVEGWYRWENRGDRRKSRQQWLNKLEREIR